jgi:hypothetical protein
VSGKQNKSGKFKKKGGKKPAYADVRHGFTRLTRDGRAERGVDEISYDES